jgi:hypothetical protein
MMNWKGFDWKQLLPNLRYYPGMFFEGLDKTMKDVSHMRELKPRKSVMASGLMVEILAL